MITDFQDGDDSDADAVDDDGHAYSKDINFFGVYILLII